MIFRNNRTGSTGGKLTWQRGGLTIAITSIFVFAGCSTMDGLFAKSKTGRLPEEQSVEVNPEERIAQLESHEQELEKEISSLKSQIEIEKALRDSLNRRLEAAQAAREEAIREVVRMRARIQGMVSPAEASAMFAEARVILDRMEEEAFNTEAVVDLELARSYMARGKGALDNGNPGGSVYLFDLIHGLYERMMKGDPRTVKVSVNAAVLRASPATNSARIALLYWGDSATGLEKTGDWIRVKTGAGQEGWIMGSQVH